MLDQTTNSKILEDTLDEILKDNDRSRISTARSGSRFAANRQRLFLGDSPNINNNLFRSRENTTKNSSGSG